MAPSRIVWIVLLVAILTSGSASQAEEGVDEPATLAKSSAWLKLNHYRPRFASREFKSEIEGRAYFLSAIGGTDPEAELREDLEQIRASQRSQRSLAETDSAEMIECRIPARFLFLQSSLSEGKNWKMPPCAKWDTFSQGTNAASVTLIFSSYFLNNPSSAFGHTFLRLNQIHSGRTHQALLDYGVGFALAANQGGPLSFVLGGLFGWFRGEFTSVPYYLKVQEYNNFESRDLWEYDLNLSPSEVELLVAHLWELSHAQIQYKYLSANCASLLFSALDAAAPRLELTKRLPYWVIPSDTIKALFEVPGLVQAFHYRPSKRSQFHARFASLSQQAKSDVVSILHSLELPVPKTEPETSPESLDAMIDYVDYRNFKELLRDDPGVSKFKQELLLARSQFPAAASETSTMPTAETPHLGHRSARASVGGLSSRLGESAVLLGQRFALHDHLDRQEGFPQSSEISFLDFRFRALLHANSVEDNQASLRPEQIYAFAVKSYTPLETLIRSPSWNFRLGAERTWDESCTECLATVAGGALGASLDLTPWPAHSHQLIATLLLAGDASASSEFGNSPIKFRLGPELNLRAVLKSVVVNINATYLHLFLTPTSDCYRIAEEVRYSLSRDFGVGASLNHLPRGDSEIRTEFYYFY